MKFADYAPPTHPSLEQQQDALQKGLGRAALWAREGCLEDAPLLEACLQDRRYDRQIEDTRGDWLWQLIQTVGAQARFRTPILHALYELSEEANAKQLCELARYYAATGDETFRGRLYEIVARRPVADAPWVGEEEIIALDGEAGFAFAAGIRGRELANREWDWNDKSLADEGIECLGQERLNCLLKATTDESLHRFLAAWHQKVAKIVEPGRVPPLEERMRLIPLAEIITTAQADTPRLGHLRSWGRFADPVDLEAILRLLFAAKDPKVITRLLRIFSGRALPQFDARLFELCNHSEATVRWGALQALAQNSHASIREFARSELERGVCERFLVSLLIRNFEAGDENWLLNAIQLPGDVCELHWLLMDVLNVLENNPVADVRQLATAVYALTPCANCRFDAVRLMHKRDATPEWMRREGCFDSDADCRKLFVRD
jgi:hypothetical protein